jgi:hypothetical protein
MKKSLIILFFQISLFSLRANSQSYYLSYGISNPILNFGLIGPEETKSQAALGQNISFGFEKKISKNIGFLFNFSSIWNDMKSTNTIKYNNNIKTEEDIWGAISPYVNNSFSIGLNYIIENDKKNILFKPKFLLGFCKVNPSSFYYTLDYNNFSYYQNWRVIYSSKNGFYSSLGFDIDFKLNNKISLVTSCAFSYSKTSHDYNAYVEGNLSSGSDNFDGNRTIEFSVMNTNLGFRYDFK